MSSGVVEMVVIIDVENLPIVTIFACLWALVNKKAKVEVGCYGNESEAVRELIRERQLRE